MKLHYLFVILPVLMILTAATTRSGTRQATCVVDVWSNLDFSWSPGRFTPVYDVVKAALCREMGPRAQEMLGIAPEALTEYLTFEPTPDNYPPKSSLVGPGSGQPSRLTFALKLDDKAKSAAQEFLDQMIAALPGVIDRLQGQ